ncbi:MAG: hypothetical protein IJW48_04300 [Clostridia bacterium]|nr:hypothetical protein [Clostridia bacterium]
MLRKTLKYDLGAVYKIWLILSATVLVLSVVGGLSIRDLVMTGDEGNPFMLFSIMGILVTIFSLCAYVLIIELLVLFRFYQNFFTDEAYLTFTLPVKRKTLFNSKLIGAFIWSVANIAVVILAITIMLALVPVQGNGTGSALYEFLKIVLELIKLLFENFSGWAFVYCVLGVIIYLLSTVFSTLIIYACITLGCTMVRKYKLLMAIAVYYVVNMLISLLSYVASFVMSLVLISGIGLIENYSEAQIRVLVLFTLIAVASFLTVMCILAYRFSLSRIERRLNLA